MKCMSGSTRLWLWVSVMVSFSTSKAPHHGNQNPTLRCTPVPTDNNISQGLAPFYYIPQEKWRHLPTYGTVQPRFVLSYHSNEENGTQWALHLFWLHRWPKTMLSIPLQPRMNSVSPASPKVSSFSQGSRCYQIPLPPAHAWSLPPASVLHSSALSSDGIWLGSRILSRSHRCPSNQALGQKRVHTFLPSCGAFLSGRSLE